jgi:anti-sigma-K factor RskA
MSELDEMSCEQFDEVAAELALGVLTGRERAAALEHLDRCEACRTKVRQLTMTGEELLGLLPALEPPPGFETRVLDRLGIAATVPATGTRRGLARWAGWVGNTSPARRTLAAAAVVVTVLVSVLGGWGLRAVAAHPASSSLSSASLLSASHQAVGKVFLYDGNPRWVYMSVYMETAKGAVSCQLVGTNGHITTLGTFSLDDGYGAWGSADPVDNGPLSGARLLDANGTVIATASFSHPVG